MKVILLSPTPPPYGGIAGWTVRMQNTILKNGWKVEVVDEKQIGNRDVFGDNDKKKYIIEIKRCFKIWSDLYNSLRDNDAKVVHSCIPATVTSMMREYVCALITKKSKRKFIIHYRCTLSNMVKSKVCIYMFKLLTDISDSVIVLNSPSAEFVKKHSKTKVFLIPNFIERNFVLNENSKIISKQIHSILYVGGVVKTKGCYDIIKVAESFPDIQFRLVGNVQKEFIDMYKPFNVFITGEKSSHEVKKELENADVFMFVTYFLGEGFSNALLEAMAYGLPCIVTDWAANYDMIENNGGIVVEVNNIESMVTAIKELENSNKRKFQSNWNIKKVKDKYIESIVTDMYVDAYESVINN